MDLSLIDFACQYKSFARPSTHYSGQCRYKEIPPETKLTNNRFAATGLQIGGCKSVKVLAPLPLIVLLLFRI